MTEADVPAGQPEETLLGPAEIRELAEGLGVRPTKQWGQNFVIDKGTVRRIVRTAEVGVEDVVLEVGPGLGSLTLALLPHVRHLTAVEIDPRLAAQLPTTVTTMAPEVADRLTVVHTDAMAVRALPDPQPTALVANLPYNVAVPVVLHLLETLPTLEKVLVMVQLEVAERLAARPGSRVYGVPSVKADWWADVSLAGRIGRNVFWPAPNVDSGLVRMVRRELPVEGATDEDFRREVFRVVDAAFAQRRKTLRAALSAWAGSGARAEEVLRAAGVDPQARGEVLAVEQFAAIARAARDSDGLGSQA